MAKILFVHGMRMQNSNDGVLRRQWHQALLRGLRETAWGRANPARLPARDDVELVFWGDLFRAPARRRPVVTKGAGVDPLRAAYYALLRGLVRAADGLSLWDERGCPRGPVAMMVNHLVYQSAVYMNNGPLPNPDPDPDTDPGAFFQIQARFEAKLTPDTRIVVGHSLGSVIAYEGLCRKPHGVDTFITIGSPIATPGLILEPLRARLHRLINHPRDLCPPWPGVRQWLNFCAPADVWCTPVQRLAGVFDGKASSWSRVRDVEVIHGSPHDFVRTHKLTTYMQHARLHDEIAEALAWNPIRERAPRRDHRRAEEGARHAGQS